ncbi:MAG: septum formation initiator family protein [Bacteroidales bacterium]|jgi:cell division protein FtsB|nr:septum formation initiator family protein [Bacteroidales bacterium]
MDSQKILQTAKNIVTNRFFIVTVVFVLWITVIDDRNLARNHELAQKNADLEAQYREYERKIEDTRREIENLNKAEYIETIAREQYTMKKDNEDIYVVTQK